MRRTALAVAAALALTACTQDGSDDPPIQGQPQDQDGEQTEDPFAPPETVDPPEDSPPVDISRPEWSAPPENEIGSPVAMDPIVIEGPNALVALTQMTVYSTGAELRFAVRMPPRAREAGAAPQDDPMGTIGGPPSRDPGAEPPDDLLRIGVVYPDGSTTSTLEEPRGAGSEPEPPVLTRRTSQGRTFSWDYEMWLWPLPQAGDQPLQVAVEWPEQGIDAIGDLDGDEITAAQQDVVQLWPADGEP